MAELWRTYRIPALFAALNAVGLFAALLSDGIGDVLSWLALVVVVWTAFRYGIQKKCKSEGKFAPDVTQA